MSDLRLGIAGVEILAEDLRGDRFPVVPCLLQLPGAIVPQAFTESHVQIVAPR